MPTMKVIRMHEYGGPEVLKYEDEEIPTPRRGQVLVKVEAPGINYADTMRRYNEYLEKTPLPYIPGGEIAGTVAALGDGVEGFQVGDRVLALTENGYAQYALVMARILFRIPDNISFAEAASIPVQGVTAYEIIKYSGQLKPGESVLVHAAAGGVGIFSVQVAKLLGAGKVIATASSAEKLEIARSLGADELVNYTDPEWYKKVREVTGGKGADVILEMAGGDIFKQSLQCLAPFGRLVIFGVASRQLPQLNAAQLMLRNQTVTGYWLVNSMGRSQKFVEGMKELLGWIGEGKVKTVVDHVYPMADVARVHGLIESRQTTGKVVLLPWAE